MTTDQGSTYQDGAEQISPTSIPHGVKVGGCAPLTLAAVSQRPTYRYGASRTGLRPTVPSGSRAK